MARKRDEEALRDLLHLPVGEPVDLSAYDTGAPPGGPDDKAAGLAATVAGTPMSARIRSGGLRDSAARFSKSSPYAE
ncbi:hypothetical protein ACWDA7_45765 [Streptomyces sp. NPDC001156]